MILNGWKEIANYLNRGVRTVQRWEHMGIPIRRPAGRTRSAVCAVSEEIDAWLKQTDIGKMSNSQSAVPVMNSDVRLKLREALAEHHTLVSALRKSVETLAGKFQVHVVRLQAMPPKNSSPSDQQRQQLRRAA